MRKGGKSSKSNRADMEVEELLKAAEDELLLKLSINSHTTTTSSHNLDLDLDLVRRFETLKSSSSSSSKPISHPTTNITNNVHLPTSSKNQNQIGDDGKTLTINDKEDYDDDDVGRILLGSDLSTRFSALKKKKPSSTNTKFTSSITDINQSFSHNHGSGNGESEDEEDEVNKLIMWAMDAARLDPSPPTDDDEPPTDDEEDEDKSSVDDEDEVDDRRKKKPPT